MTGQLYCTTLRGSDGHVYGGPNIRATSHRRAEDRAESLGVVVDGELVGVLDGETLDPVPFHESSGNFEMNRYARERAASCSRLRLRIASALRRWACRFCTLADIVEPCPSRKRLVSVRT